jgi:hypothetical protein
MSKRISIIGGYRLTRDLLYWWDLDAGGATVTDQQSGLVLTRQTLGAGGVTSATPAPDGGTCIRFGTSVGDETRFVNASVAKPASYDTAFTVNIWVRRTSDASATGSWIINHRASSSSRHWQLNRSNTTNDVRSTVFNSSGTGMAALLAGPGLNTWYMHTLVRRGSVVELWIDAVMVATAVIGTATETGSAPYAIGADAWGALNPNPSLSTRGQLWCAGQWTRALNGAEILALYNGGAGRKYAQL